MSNNHGGKRGGSGRPVGSKTISTELRQAAQKHTNDALAVLVDVMNTAEHPQRLKAAELVLQRGHGSAREVSASESIITQFMAGEISPVTACLLLEAEGLTVPPVMRQYFNYEIKRQKHNSGNLVFEQMPAMPRE